MNTFGESLTQCRLRAGLTQTELAARSGVRQSNISKIEAGQRKPSLAMALALARALGVTVEELAGAESHTTAAKRDSTSKTQRRKR